MFGQEPPLGPGHHSARYQNRGYERGTRWQPSEFLSLLQRRNGDFFKSLDGFVLRQTDSVVGFGSLAIDVIRFLPNLAMRRRSKGKLAPLRPILEARLDL